MSSDDSAISSEVDFLKIEVSALKTEIQFIRKKMNETIIRLDRAELFQRFTILAGLIIFVPTVIVIVQMILKK